MSGTAALVRADATLLPFRKRSVNLFICSPPYFGQRVYSDGGVGYAGQIGAEPSPDDFLEALWNVTRQMRYCLTDDGSIWVNLGDKYAGSGAPGTTGAIGSKQTQRAGMSSYTKATIGGARDKSLMGLPWRYAIGCIDLLGLILRRDQIWSKPNGMPESVTDRCRTSHEYWFHFTKNGDYYAGLDDLREASATANPDDPSYRANGKSTKRVKGVATPPGGTEQTLAGDVDRGATHPLGKIPGSVWQISTEPLRVPEFFIHDFLGPRAWGAPCTTDAAREKVRRDLWEHCQAEFAVGRPVHVFDVDHYAAFPQEWPRRLILGWSPPAICTRCDQPRGSQIGTVCGECDTFRPNNANSCPGCGHVRDWRAGRIVEPDMGATENGSGHATPRHPGNHQPGSIAGPITCGCPDTTAPTRPAVVVDVFGGTGTTAGVARALGRFGINMDLSADYLRMADWRIHQSGHFAKSVARTNQDRQGTLL